MSKDAENSEYGVIPKGTRIKLFEGRVTLLEDVAVDADQKWIDQAILDENNYRNGIGVVGDTPVQLATGAMSAMHVSASMSASGSQSSSYSESDSTSTSHNYSY